MENLYNEFKSLRNMGFNVCDAYGWAKLFLA